MTEKELFKQVADAQLPDFEKIRENCINGNSNSEKVRKIGFKSTKFIAIAATLTALSLIMAAVFANPGGVFFPTQPEVTPTEVTKTPVIATTAEDKPKSTDFAEDKSGSKKDNRTLNCKDDDTELIAGAFGEIGLNTDSVKKLGDADGFCICYAGDGNAALYDCEYIIGGYTFSCENQLVPYGLGLYAVAEGEALELGEAFKTGRLTSMDDVAKMVRESEIEVEVNENDREAEAIKEYFSCESIALVSLGETDEGNLFFSAEGSDPEGIYFISDYTVYTLAEAESHGLINREDAMALISAAMEKGAPIFPAEENSEETSPSETEPETEDESEAAEEEAPTEPDETKATEETDG